MGFYYYNIFSFGLLALAYGVLTLVAVAIAFGTRHAPRRVELPLPHMRISSEWSMKDKHN
jgi:hypothetical protein